MSQSHRSAPAEDPACTKCGAPMILASIEEKYPGYHRRTFECSGCGATMTEWAG
jgi:ribosomal protein S27AE